MAKVTNRTRILNEGLRVVHERGLTGASVRDIIQAAGVPQGSFTNHFVSKEAFCLEVLEIYFEGTREVLQETVLNEALSPTARMRAYYDANVRNVTGHGLKNGCLIGNFSIETGAHSEVIRQRLVEIYEEIRGAVTWCLKAAASADELASPIAPDVLGGFIVSSLQGAIMQAKVELSPAPLERFGQVLFTAILKPQAGMAVKSKAKRRSAA
jgi:TetR/AcrR family transcriptional regulator, transcriptional repressor for nem operon